MGHSPQRAENKVLNTLSWRLGVLSRRGRGGRRRRKNGRRRRLLQWREVLWRPLSLQGQVQAFWVPLQPFPIMARLPPPAVQSAFQGNMKQAFVWFLDLQLSPTASLLSDSPTPCSRCSKAVSGKRGCQVGYGAPERLHRLQGEPGPLPTSASEDGYSSFLLLPIPIPSSPSSCSASFLVFSSSF